MHGIPGRRPASHFFLYSRRGERTTPSTRRAREKTQEWNVFVDPYATAYLFTETSFPIAIVPLDVCDKLPIPGQFMDTLRAANSSECNQGIYEALLVSYDTFAAEQPFYRLWDSGAVMYYLDPEDYGEPEVTEICIGTSWTYLGGLFRKSKVDEDVPSCVEINQ